MKKINNTKTALNGMLIALALILSYIESLIPLSFAVPGMKVGLTNLVVLYALYEMDAKSAFFINIIRIILVGILFGTGFSIAYSLAGGMLSFGVMYLLRRFGKIKMISVSIVGALSHNAGQILTAMLITETTAVIWYFAVLWFWGIFAGFIIGIICVGIIYRIRKISNEAI